MWDKGLSWLFACFETSNRCSLRKHGTLIVLITTALVRKLKDIIFRWSSQSQRHHPIISFVSFKELISYKSNKREKGKHLWELWSVLHVQDSFHSLKESFLPFTYILFMMFLKFSRCEIPKLLNINGWNPYFTCPFKSKLSWIVVQWVKVLHQMDVRQQEANRRNKFGFGKPKVTNASWESSRRRKIGALMTKKLHCKVKLSIIKSKSAAHTWA